MNLTTPTVPVVGFMELVELNGRNDSPDGKSAVELLCDQLEAHEKEEADLLASYEEAARSEADAGVSFLMNLILEDEKRHHGMMQSMAEEVRDSLLWLHDGPPLPVITAAGEERKKLLRQTQTFLRIEREGLRDLEMLEKKTKDLHSGMLALMIDTMRADTNKHAHILEYIEKQLA